MGIQCGNLVWELLGLGNCDGPITAVVLLPRWLYYQGSLITEVVLLQSWSYYHDDGITITPMCGPRGPSSTLRYERALLSEPPLIRDRSVLNRGLLD